MTKISYFQKYCEKALDKLTEDDVDKFKVTTREEERIKLMYPFAKTIPINLVDNGKSFEVAQHEKLKGNKLFATKNYQEAIIAYNQGIIKCPQDSDEGKELLAILVSNRSATYFEQNEFRKCLDDINYAIELGCYPKRLHHKIWLRKAKCYEALQYDMYVAETYQLYYQSLKHADFNEAERKKRQEEVEESRLKEPKRYQNKEIAIAFNEDQFTGGNKEYIAAHKNIYFEFDPLLGRYARALESIETGVIIIEELPHCAVVSAENALKNCQNCCISTLSPIPCSKCGHVIFCSLNCARKADLSYHRFECGIQPILFESGASINCSMALRMITQKPLGFFTQQKKALKDYLKDNCKKVAIKNSLYRSDQYITAFFLCRNEHLRKKGELVHYSSMAIFLLRLLKFTNYFCNGTDDDILSEDETFIASLILRHLQILQFNSHEISEIRNTEKADKIHGIEVPFRNEHVGAGLYPTLALFNHSCDPSLVRYNIGNKMIARTIKPVKAGDIIYENYGPLYTTTSLEERRALLRERYWFECYCTPCQEEWPLFEEMDPNQIKLGCQTDKCPFEFILRRDDFCPYLQCDYCNNVTKVVPLLRALSELAVMLPQAENAFSSGQFREAMKHYMKALDILYKYSKPPCPDMVKVQQRLRTIFLRLGNKESGYIENL